MLIKKAVGRGGSSRKYDLLTVLGAFALSQEKQMQRQVLRLICLITARYNWQNDQLSLGQEDIARLWSVDPRTVKREMAAFRARGWLVEKRAAARGRVTLYGLGLDRILADTRPAWEAVGADLVARLEGQGDESPPAPEQTRIIPFPLTPVADTGHAPLWDRISRQMQQRDPAVWRAWIAPLVPEETPEGLHLRAPSGFHASYVATHLAPLLETALRGIAPGATLRVSGNQQGL